MLLWSVDLCLWMSFRYRGIAQMLIPKHNTSESSWQNNNFLGGRSYKKGYKIRCNVDRPNGVKYFFTIIFFLIMSGHIPRKHPLSKQSCSLQKGYKIGISGPNGVKCIFAFHAPLSKQSFSWGKSYKMGYKIGLKWNKWHRNESSL